MQYMEAVKSDGSDESEGESEDDSSDESDGEADPRQESAEEDETPVPTEPPEEAAEDAVEEEAELSDLQRSLSRSPPRSRTGSPTSLEKPVASLALSDIKEIVSADLSKTRSQQLRKYHSKRNTRRAGRSQGSKAKQDTRIKLDTSGVWD
jgi:RIO kinase 2